MSAQGLLETIKRAVELCRPNLRHYYRMTRKARVVASYASDGRYYADVRPLRNDESVDEAEPVVPKVEIPVIWAGPKRGVVCPPVVGAHCDLSYYDGDPNYPRISNFRWHGMDAPAAALDEFVIQLEPGVEIRIDRQKHVVTLTPENVRTEAGQDIEATAGKNWTVQAGDNAEITAGANINVSSAMNMTLTAGTNLTTTVTGNAALTVAGTLNATVAGATKLICPSVDVGGEGGLGVVTQECICMLTGLPHVEGSSIVRAKK